MTVILLRHFMLLLSQQATSVNLFTIITFVYVTLVYIIMNSIDIQRVIMTVKLNQLRKKKK